MARFKFGGDIAAFGILPPSGTGGVVNALIGATGTVWDSPEGGEQFTELLDSDGITPREDIETDVNGFLVPFYAPDEVAAVWLDFGGGARGLLVSAEAVQTAAEQASDTAADLAVLKARTHIVLAWNGSEYEELPDGFLLGKYIGPVQPPGIPVDNAVWFRPTTTPETLETP